MQRGSAARILVVEDEGIIADDLQSTLQRLGYDVPATLATGSEAIAAIESNPHDLVLMDIHLRGEMDGVEAAEVIRERFGVPIVYLTSYSDDETFARVQRTEPYACLLKPFDERSLRNTIELTLQRRALQRRLEDRERWFATTLRSIGDAVIATDPGGRITFLNATAEHVTGWTRDDALGRPVDEVLAFVDERGRPIASPVGEALTKLHLVELQAGASLVQRSGASVGVDDMAAPIVDEAGALLGGVVVFRDVTARRRLEERVALSERLAALGTLAAGLGHEINNPLTYVLANLGFCIEAVERADSRGDPAKARELLDALREARDGGDRVRGVVERLRGFVRADDSPRQAMALEDVANEAIRQTRHQLHQHARVVLVVAEDRAVDVDVVPGELVQVVTNLLVNAGHAVASKGGGVGARTITVRVDRDADGRARLVVADDGVGIAPENLGRVFEPFFTTKPSSLGTGLGLSLSHAIVRDHGGELSIRSALGVGTEVTVVLPARAGARSTSATPASPEAPTIPARRRILVIDDEPSIGKSIARVLAHDHDVEVFSAPNEALERLLRGPDPDVVFCDLMMPGLSGMELFRRLEAERPQLSRRLVFLTGGAYTPEAAAFLESSAVPTLIKPFRMDVLRAFVARSGAGA